MQPRIKIALLQMNSQLDYKHNMAKIMSMKSAIWASRAEWLFLPESFYSYGMPGQLTPHVVEEENEHYLNLLKLARDLHVYLVGGSAVTRVGEKIFNRSYVISPEGNIVSIYDKCHLFSCDLSSMIGAGQKIYQEGALFSPGEKAVITKIGDCSIGLSICFDLRFPEMYREYGSRGVELLSISSAFTVPTGKAHWKALLRARAIENQAYVVAAGQWGEHNGANSTYGHSMVIDPWGKIIIDAGEGEGLYSAEIDLSLVKSVRQRMSVWD